MPRSRQVGLRLEEDDEKNLKRIAQLEGRSEQDILRESLRMYVRHRDEQTNFVASVERGWYEIHSGLGEVITENDDFFEAISREIRHEETSS